MSVHNPKQRVGEVSLRLYDREILREVVHIFLCSGPRKSIGVEYMGRSLECVQGGYVEEVIGFMVGMQVRLHIVWHCRNHQNTAERGRILASSFVHWGGGSLRSKEARNLEAHTKYVRKCIRDSRTS